MKTKLRRLSAVAAGVAVILASAWVIVFSIVGASDNAFAYHSILDESIIEMRKAETMVMKLNFMTTDNENFDAIRMDGSMRTHTISVIYSDPIKWRVQKKGRGVYSDGEKQYLWLDILETGYVLPANANTIEWLWMFIQPAEILEKEKQQSEKNRIVFSENDNEIYLTVYSVVDPAFENDYLFNSSIETSNNRREYIFDKKTSLLKRMKVFVRNGQQDILIAETIDIAYNTPINPDELAKKPSHYDWVSYDIPKVRNPEFEGLSPVPTARKLLEYLSQGRTEDLKGMFEGGEKTWFARENIYLGSVITEIGEPFESEAYLGLFVPLNLTLADGEQTKRNVALRYDNSRSLWTVTGGL